MLGHLIIGFGAKIVQKSLAYFEDFKIFVQRGEYCVTRKKIWFN